LKLSEDKKELLVFLGILSAIIGAFSLFYFGLTGLRVFIGIILATIPFYIFFNTFDLTEGEKFVLSIISGITLFPSFVYLLGFFMPFRMSIGIVLVLLTGIVVGWSYFKTKKN